MVKKTDKMSRSKFNICWISILVIFIGTIAYPISYERAERKALANANLKNLIDTLTPLPTIEDVQVVPTDSDMTTEVILTPEPIPTEPVPSIDISTDTESLFNRDLKLGDRGPDVKLLQQLLNQWGFTVAVSGPGSPGNESELFGASTRDALIRFQEANRAVLLEPYGLSNGTGYFGAASRVLLSP